MKFRTIPDYLNALMLCKKFSSLKSLKESELELHDQLIKKQYDLTPKSYLSASKVFKALRDYQANKFELFGSKENGKIPGFEVLFVDHKLPQINLKQFSFPSDTEYRCSMEELR